MAVGKEMGPFVEEEEQEILHLPQIPAREEQHTGVRGGFMGVEAIWDPIWHNYTLSVAIYLLLC